MKLLFIRHGDPDYENDTLTEKGHREAALLADRLSGMNISAFYVSPLGRAQRTAQYTLEKYKAEAKTCPWLREFDVLINDENREGMSIPWDMLPQNWTKVSEYYDKDKWTEVPVMKNADMRENYNAVANGLDKILEAHGYKRKDNYYEALRPNSDTIAFFCHFGVTCVMISHLIGVSPMVLWHGTAAPPTSVTTFNTEERRQGIASFRMSGFGDVSHLIMNNEPVSLSARFCELYTNQDQRHD